MRYDPANHTIQLKYCSDFYQKWGGIWYIRHIVASRSSAYPRDFDIVCPGDEECRVVLPVQCAFEEIRARTFGWSVDEGNYGL